MPSDNPPLRLLIATPTRLGTRFTAALAALCPSLAEQGITVTVLEGGSGPMRAERTAAPGYTRYRSTQPAADCALLAALEAPHAAILLGADSLSLAAPLLAAHIPVLLRQDGDQPPALGPLAANRLLGLATGTEWEAERLAASMQTAVAVLPLALPPRLPVAKGGPAVLILSDQTATGLTLALALAAARPDIPFLLPETVPVVAATLPENIRLVRDGETPPPIRLALLPQGSGCPPWADLAATLSAGVPILGGDAPLLAAAIGPAGVSLPLTAGLPAWLAALDGLMGRARPTVSVCRSQGARLLPDAAPLWGKALRDAVRRSREMIAGTL